MDLVCAAQIARMECDKTRGTAYLLQGLKKPVLEIFGRYVQLLGIFWRYIYGIYELCGHEVSVRRSPNVACGCVWCTYVKNKHRINGSRHVYLEPQTTIYKWMFGETTISYVKIGNHPIETTIYKWLFGVPGSSYVRSGINRVSVMFDGLCIVPSPSRKVA